MFNILYLWLLLNFTFLFSFGGELAVDEKKIDDNEAIFPFEELEKEDNYSTDIQEEEVGAELYLCLKFCVHYCVRLSNEMRM